MGFCKQSARNPLASATFSVAYETLSVSPIYIKFMKSNYKYWIVIIPIFSLIAFLYFSNHFIDSDEGSTLNVAWHLWFGKKIFKDFYEFTSPGASILIFLIWKLFSATYLSAKLFSIVLFISSALLLLATVKKFRPNLSWFRTSAVLFIWLVMMHTGPLINHNSFSSFAAILFMFCGTLILSKVRLHYFIFLGLMNALVFVLLQTKGLVLLLPAFYLVLNMESFKGRFYAGLIYIFSFAFPVLAFLYSLSLKESIQSLFFLPRTIGYLDSTFFLPWLAVIGAIITISMFYAYYFLKKKVYLFLALLQLSLFISILYNFDIVHFLINAFPTIVFISVVVKDLHLNEHKYSSFLRNVLVLQLCCWSIGLIGSAVINTYLGPNIFSDKNSLTRDLGEIKMGSVYTGPFLPGLYFELNQENRYTPYNNMIYCRADCLSETLNLLTTEPPEYALMNYQMVAKYHYQKNDIDRFFEQSYQKCHPVDGLVIYARERCPIN